VHGLGECGAARKLLDRGDDVREQEIAKEIEGHVNRIRETRIGQAGSDQISKHLDTLLEVVEEAVAALNVRYRHYGPTRELRVEPDEWVKAEDVLQAMIAALQEGIVRDIFAGVKPNE
jgi:hypothetical protein